MNHYGDKHGLLVLSRNAIFTEVLTTRNYGKTWTFKKRAFRRAMKRGRKTIWLRMFKNEAKEAAASFFSSSDLCRYCGVQWYDKEKNTGNVRQEGKTLYYRRNGKSGWQWFIKVFALSDANAIRSADDVKIDTIVFDEFTKTPDKITRYRGNVASDFIDIFFSLKREHEVRAILLGNKESFSNPINSYFGIKPLPSSFEGIRTYRKGSFVLQQINAKPAKATAYESKVKALLSGTAYGDYIYDGKTKTEKPFKKRKAPAGATLYAQIYINAIAFKIAAANGYFYVSDKIETSKPIYCDMYANKYAHERRLIKKHKQFFNALVNAISDGRVYYDNAATYEAASYFYKWLNI